MARRARQLKRYHNFQTGEYHAVVASKSIPLAQVSSVPQALDFRGVIWPAAKMAFFFLVVDAIVWLFSPYRAAQLREFVVIIGFLTLLMVAYKKINGIKVVW